MLTTELDPLASTTPLETRAATGSDAPLPFNGRTADVAVIGLGYVGLTLAVALAERGKRVLGFEANAAVRELLARGKTHFQEKGLAEPFRKHLGDRLLLCQSMPAELPPVIMVCVGTPVDEQTRLPDLDHLESAIRAVSERIRPETLVIIRSTVPVGTTRRLVLPLLRQAVAEPKLAFCPERTIQGQALDELQTLPQIVGGLTGGAAAEAVEFFRSIASETITVSSMEAAEMIKLICNAHTDVLYGFGNQVALMAEALGLDADELIASANLHYPRPDLARPGFVGGSCLTKDPYLLIHSAEACGYFPPIVAAARQLNESIPSHVADRAVAALQSSGKRLDRCRILVSGLAYKGRPETDDLRGGPAGPIVSALRRYGARLVGHDFVVTPDHIAREVGLEPVSLADGFANSDAVLLLNNHARYTECDIRPLAMSMRFPAVIVDVWGVLADQFPPGATPWDGISYVRLGCA